MVETGGRGSRREVMEEADILVVGAGPTGLTLALQAHDHGARVRIVDRRSQPFRPSRAMNVHPRTLEVLRPLGVTDALLAHGDRRPTAALHLGRSVVAAGLSDLELPDTAFPHLLPIRQSDVEAELLAAAIHRGLSVEWGTAVETYRIASGEPIATSNRDGAGAHWDTLPGRSGRHHEHGTAHRRHHVRRRVLSGGCRACRRRTRRSGSVRSGARGCRQKRARLPVPTRGTGNLAAAGHGSEKPSGEPYGQVGPLSSGSELDLLVENSGIDARISDVGWSARIRVQHWVAARYRVGQVLIGATPRTPFRCTRRVASTVACSRCLGRAWSSARELVKFQRPRAFIGSCFFGSERCSEPQDWVRHSR